METHGKAGKVKRFYDPHCHVFELSHPGLLLFIMRAVKELGIGPKDGKGKTNWCFFLVLILLLIIQVFGIILLINCKTHTWIPIVLSCIGVFDLALVTLLLGIITAIYSIFVPISRHDKLPAILTCLFNVCPTLKRMFNTLALFENDIGEQLLLMENDFNKDKQHKLHINDDSYEQLVLTPLILDFGEKGRYPIKAAYQHFARKPIENQVLDLFNGILRYYQEGQPIGHSNLHKFLEIYPFLGINTRNYPLHANKQSTGVVDLLEKYFSNYEPDPQRLSQTIRTFDGNIANMRSNFFAGIKLYPPLGFDPEPDAAKEGDEREKTEWLFQFCQDHNIPITFHCSNGGFQVAECQVALRNADPRRWRAVLERYPRLKINFAHFGGDIRYPNENWSWSQEIMEIMQKFPNVYTDFAFGGSDPRYYDTIYKRLKKNPVLIERLLFGSDFSIVLLKTDSYAEYYSLFTHSKLARKYTAQLVANAERFLFG